MVVDIPEVPGSKQDDDLGEYRDNNRAMRYEDDRDRPSDNYNNFRDFHYSEYEDTRTESHENSRMGPCESLIGELRTALSRNDATITLHGRGNIHNRVPMSYKVFLQAHLSSLELCIQVSGFNSFHVRRCDPISRGVLSLSLSFNELTFTASDQAQLRFERHPCVYNLFLKCGLCRILADNSFSLASFYLHQTSWYSALQ